jgi:hypothetical protein
VRRREVEVAVAGQEVDAQPRRGRRAERREERRELRHRELVAGDPEVEDVAEEEEARRIARARREQLARAREPLAVARRQVEVGRERRGPRPRHSSESP